MDASLKEEWAIQALSSESKAVALRQQLKVLKQYPRQESNL
jgi:hypothetical protein